MSNLSYKINSNQAIRSTVLALDNRESAHPHMIVSTIDGRKLNLNARQVYNNDNLYMISNTWRYNSTGDISSLLTNGGQATIQINRSSGSGHNDIGDSIWLRLLVQPGANCNMIPAPQWINNIQFLTPSGIVTGQETGDSIWTKMVQYYDDESWSRISQLVNSNRYYGPGPELVSGQTYEIYIPLIGNFLSTTNLLLAFVNADMNVNVTFQPSSITLVSGDSAPTITQMSLDVRMEYMRSSDLTANIKMHKEVPYHYFYPYMRQMNFTQTYAANTQYQFQLSGIQGAVNFILFFLRSSTSGYGLNQYTQIANFNFLDDSGAPISTSFLESDAENRYATMPDLFPGKFSQYEYLYGRCFSHSPSGPMAMLSNGLLMGSFPFSTKEYISVTMPGSGTNEVWTATPSGTPASGSYSLIFYNGETGVSEQTAELTYNATASTIEAALEGLTNFTGTATVSGPFSAAATITFGGDYANYPLDINGYSLQVVPYNLLTSGSAGVTYSVTTTTTGVVGITSGNTYQLVVMAFSNALLKLDTNGDIMAYIN